MCKWSGVYIYIFLIYIFYIYSGENLMCKASSTALLHLLACQHTQLISVKLYPVRVCVQCVTYTKPEINRSTHISQLHLPDQPDQLLKEDLTSWLQVEIRMSGWCSCSLLHLHLKRRTMIPKVHESDTEIVTLMLHAGWWTLISRCYLSWLTTLAYPLF